MGLRQHIRRIIYKLAYPLARIYWFIFRPKTRGVKCLVEYNNKFLLVRLNYSHRRFTIPGGGVGRNESFKDAAVREILEETGVDLDEVVLIGRYERVIEYKNDTVEVYYAQAGNSTIKIDPIEIGEVGWFTRDNLPLDRTPQTDQIFEMYDEYKSKCN